MTRKKSFESPETEGKKTPISFKEFRELKETMIKEEEKKKSDEKKKKQDEEKQKTETKIKA